MSLLLMDCFLTKLTVGIQPVVAAQRSESMCRFVLRLTGSTLRHHTPPQSRRLELACNLAFTTRFVVHD